MFLLPTMLFGGTVARSYYYALGGTVGGTHLNDIDRGSIATDGNSTDVANLTDALGSCCGIDDGVYGYCIGGWTSAAVYQIQTERFNMLTDSNSAHCSRSISGNRIAMGGAKSIYSGYVLGGGNGFDNGAVNIIEKFTFASTANFTDVGNLAIRQDISSVTYSTLYAYDHGGYYYNAAAFYHNNVEKVSLSTDGNTTDVGDLLSAIGYNSPMQSATYGYSAGGNSGTLINVIQKNSFATDGNSTDVADLLAVLVEACGNWSASHGYVSGGWDTARTDRVQKMHFGTEANTTDVGNLSVVKMNPAGSIQY